MKTKNLWLYLLFGVAVGLILLGVFYTKDQKTTSEELIRSIPDSIRAQFDQIDANRNGVISLDEFAKRVAARVKLAKEQTKKDRLKRLQLQFEAGDKNKDSFISPDEYSELILVKELGDQAQSLQSFDSNGDGKLGFREYIGFREEVGTK